MKKSFAALAALAAAGAASAQSTVTLYGAVDAMVANDRIETTTGAGVTTVNRQNRLSPGGLSGNRWGMRVREDLGGGLAAIATMEAGFNIDTGASGQGGRLFGRESWVGLMGGFGKLTLGRQYSMYDDVRATADQTGNSTFSPAVGYINGGSTDVGVFATVGSNYSARIDNSIRYELPADLLKGFTAGVSYGFGENRTATADAGFVAALKLGYEAGPLWVGAAYQREKNSNGSTTFPTLVPAVSGAPALTHAMLGSTYDFGVAKLFATYNVSRRTSTTGAALAALPATAPATAAASARDREAQLGVIVPFGATSLRAGYAIARSTSGLAGAPTEKGAGFGLELLHSLSKRTTVYAAAVATKDENDGYSSGATAKRRQFGAGIRHRF